MYEALKIVDPPLIPACVLTGLGRINVICGQNNSGKSTLLKRISDGSYQFGRGLGENDLQSMLTETIYGQNQPWQNSRVWAEALKALLTSLASESPTWFDRDEESFTAKVAKGLQGRVTEFRERPLSEAYRKRLGPKAKTALLPPKRALRTQCDINTGERAMPDGQGLLNQLLHSKTQPRYSEERSWLDQVRSAFIEISSGYDFEVQTQNTNSLVLNFFKEDQAWVNAEDCGLGLRDLLVILSFAIAPDLEMLLIEEPESHMHPEMERKLLAYLRESTDKQYFLTTHSNVFLDNAYVDRVFFTSYDGQVQVRDVTSRASFLDNLGYSIADNLISDVVILVEGPTDIPPLREFLKKMDLYGSYNIKMWPLGGDIMDQVDLSVFAQTYNILALVDNDPKSRKVRKRFIENCKSSGIPVHRLSAYSIENYFTPRVLREVFGSQIPDSFVHLDPKVKVEKQIGFSVKKSNGRLAGLMRLDEIEETDLGGFLRHIEGQLRSPRGTGSHQTLGGRTVRHQAGSVAKSTRSETGPEASAQTGLQHE